MAVAGSGSPAAAGASNRNPAASVARLEGEVVERVNRIRTQRGLPPLQIDPELAALARAHSCRMARQGFFAHTSPSDGTVADRVREAGLEFRAVAENLARNANVPDPAAVAVEGWLQSEEHRDNLLRPTFTRTGVGACAGDPGHYFTQIFLEPR